MEVLIINNGPHPLPSYQTEGAAGMDVRAWLADGSISLKPLERILVQTGLNLQIPEGFEIQVRPRSGLAAKQGITLLNAPGTIDSDYRGELKIILVNLSNEVQEIHDGDRIAQLVLAKYETIHWKKSDVLDATNRAGGGFGHTGSS